MRKWLCMCLAAVLLAGCAAGAKPAGGVSPGVAATGGAAAAASGETAAPGRLSCLYYDKDRFLDAVSAPCSYEMDGRLYAGVVPHHLVAADMIAGFFALAGSQEQAYDTVLLVSPSHYKENCGSMVVTAGADWDTPLGLVHADEAFVQALLAAPGVDAEDNPKAVEFDHGVAGLIPFVRQYLPGAQVGVCLLQNGLPAERLDAVVQTITDWCRRHNALLVISMDCSHYLFPDEAAEHDRQTEAAIESFDFAAISRFTDSNVDSPESLTVFLRRVQQEQGVPVQLDHASSPQKLPQSIDNPIYEEGITTYYVYGARDPA